MERPRLKLLNHLYEYSGDGLNLEEEEWNDAKSLVKVFDYYMTDFANWLNNGRFTQYGSHWINPKLSKDLNGDWLFFTSQQLLEIYKKENEL